MPARRRASGWPGRDVVAVQDTSELVLGGRRAAAADYGPVGKGGCGAACCCIRCWRWKPARGVAGPGVDAGVEPWRGRAGAAAPAGDAGQGIAALDRGRTTGRRGSGCARQHHGGVGSRERLLRAVRRAPGQCRSDRAGLPEPAHRGAGRPTADGPAVRLHRRPSPSKAASRRPSRPRPAGANAAPSLRCASRR